MERVQAGLENPTLQKIESVAKEIKRKFRPKKIVLFGSYAYGKPRAGSDVDLLVIMETDRRPVEQAVAIRRAVDFPFPVDLLVRTPEQIEQRLNLGDFFVAEIMSNGKVLYETDNQ